MIRIDRHAGSGLRRKGFCWLGLIGLLAGMGAHAAPGSVSYSYDETGRLRNASYGGCAATAYTLDAAGNRTNVQATTASTLRFAAATYSVSEANASVTISVTRACNTTAATSVSYTLGGTAVQGTHYSISGTLSWAAGDATAKSLTLTTVDNSVYAANKTVILTLSAPTGGAIIGTPGATTVTITENDPQPIPGAVQFTASTLSVGEGTASAQLTITRAGAGGAVPAASVVCTPANGTATGGSDFTAGAQTINWAANDVSNKTCSIPILNDSTFENSETFTVALSSPTGGMTLGSPTGATVTVTDNDATSFSIANASVNESAGTVTLTVTKTGASALTHAVNYASAGGSATSGSDFTAVSGTLTFAPADTSKTFTVSIANDTAYEGNEAFTASLSLPTNGATLGTSSATVTIIDDETPPSFSINSVFVNEIDGTATLTVTKSGGTIFTHNVNYASANGSAVSGTDYTAVSGTLAFTSAQTSQNIVVSINNDTTYEASESFSVSLSAPTNSAVLGTGTGTVTIAPDNDAAPLLIFTTATVSESAGSLTVTVTKGGNSDLTHQVSYATNGGTATSGVDFTPVSGTLTFAPGDYAQSVVIGITNDSLYESTEGFAFVISNATNGALPIQGPPGGAIYIEDDDTPPVPGTIQFSAPFTTSVGESAPGSVTLYLSRTGASGPFGAASVLCQTYDGTAVAGPDYTAVSQTISWAAGDSSTKTCTIPIIDDANFELTCVPNPFYEPPEMPFTCSQTETFQVYLSNVSGASLGSAMSVTITVFDEDSPVPP